MRLYIGKAFNSLKLTDYLEEEQEEDISAPVILRTQKCMVNRIVVEIVFGHFCSEIGLCKFYR